MSNLSPASSGDLIPVFDGILNGEHQPLVDARALHEFLGVGRDFSHWIKDRIKDYGFVENADYSCSSNLASGENQSLSRFWGGHNRIDYHLSLDMAKELAMVERSDKGREVRRYFIAVERAARELEIPAITRKAQAENRHLQARIEELQDAYARAHPDDMKLLRYRGMGLTHAEIGLLLKLSRQSIGHRLKRLASLGFIGEAQQLALPEV